jgi:hypothetical protein
MALPPPAARIHLPDHRYAPRGLLLRAAARFYPVGREQPI